MSEAKLISPILDGFAIGGAISDRHGIRCYPAMPNNSDKRYIVKVISIPASKVQLDALLLAGAYSSQDSALAYFKELAEGVAAEADILKKLSRFEGFIPFEDIQTVSKEDNTGYDVYLLSRYGRTLERHMKKKPMTHLNAVNLGLDLCASMVVSRRMGYLYVNLKPSNIYINEKQEFRIGDLGFIKMDSLQYASLPEKYRSAYTAPEISDAWSSLNSTLDTYAIGMILYQVYNDGKLPFDGQAGKEELPPPLYADYEMAEIILKAIDPNPELRWTDPMLMGQALVAYMQRNTVNDVPIIPVSKPIAPVSADEPTTVIPETNEAVADSEESVAVPAEASETAEKVPAEDAQAQDDVADDAEVDLIPSLVLEDDVLILPADPEETPADTSAVSAEPSDPLTDLSFMDDMVSDDTAPDEATAGEAEYAALSAETSDMLSLADELIAMEMPEPVVAPEPIDIPIPAPIVLEDEPESEAPGSDVEEPAAATEEAAGETPSQEAASEEISEPAGEETTEAEPEPVAEEEAFDETTDEPEQKVRHWGKIIAAASVIILLIAALLFGYHYYNNYYLQTVDSLRLEGDANNLIVIVESKVDESLLTVVCTDTYGTTRQEAVTDGKAVFENLDPDTIYQIKVVIDGFHELKGDITDDYTTPAQTNIVRFDAIAGSEEGSVVLNFSIDGKDSNNWTVTYSAEGEETQSVSFTGRLITITGLALGKEYTFTLTSSDSMYIVGKDTVTFTTDALIFAQSLDIISCDASGLTAAWSAPEGVTVNSWTVRCYSDAGYDTTVTTSELTYTFTDIDLTQGYTVEVTAEGMSMGTRAYVSPNCATITDFQADVSIPMELTVRWEFTGNAPQTGWLVLYNLEGDDQQKVIQTAENTVTLTNATPGATYEFVIQAADGTTVYGETYTCTAADVEIFSGYGITADDIKSVYMFTTPDDEDWVVSDINLYSAPTTEFAPGEQISLLFELDSDAEPETSNDVVTTLFVVRDMDGNQICRSSSDASWVYMWEDGWCALDVPTIPTTSGDYYLNIYFNGMAITQLFFTVTE